MKWVFFLGFLIFTLFGFALSYDGNHNTQSLSEVWIGGFSTALGFVCFYKFLCGITFKRKRRQGRTWKDSF